MIIMLKLLFFAIVLYNYCKLLDVTLCVGLSLMQQLAIQCPCGTVYAMEEKKGSIQKKRCPPDTIFLK